MTIQQRSLGSRKKNDVMKVAPIMSSQCSFFCHPSSPFFVIPVP
ncbi:hypothetical protein [Wolbachia pipientis]|nr:hypothetical protein [Wolbachia pipientis]